MSPAEFPEPEVAFWVHETHRLASGGSLTTFAAGPFDQPEEAKQARQQLHAAEPGRNLHCAEHRIYE
ncbi:hypothetical protein [Salinisphaera sp. Q1T1-3]|uniref:hypothetical protein n=1 Tax=Salinisphaera sp. Q1T1-3 TaxID=2321229 RepID=UPI000E76FF6B|nr:hypothetical protein [Salinisphaera sp. Q1T1-3]RJS95278.1 hypothetical protein D3260_01630 [Salinisphaera sp. Q1T1-3]